MQTVDSGFGKGKILVILPLLLYFLILPWMPLMEPDEGRYSAIPQEMNRSGDYVTPRLKQVVYLEKPPLCYWATAAAFRIFGENEFSARLFVALSTWGCILLVYAMGRRFHGSGAGLTAAALFATSLYPFGLGRVTTLDMPLTFFVCLAVWLGYLHVADKTGRCRLYGFFLSCGLAFLAKGLIGVVFPFAILSLWLVLTRRFRDLIDFFSPVGILILLVVTVPWIVLVQIANPDFFHFFFIQEHMLRFTTPMHEKTAPFYYYVPIVLAGFMPWLVYLPKARHDAPDSLAALFPREERIFFAVWVGFIFLFFSMASSKLLPYIAPVFLPLSVMLGVVFHRADGSDTPACDRKRILKDEWPVWGAAVILLVLILAPPFIESHDVPLTFGQWWPRAVPSALAILALGFLPTVLRIQGRRTGFSLRLILTAVFLVSLLPPARFFLSPYRSAETTARAVQQRVPVSAPVYQYRISLYGIDFYTRRRTPVVEDIGELRFGVEKLSEVERRAYFLTADEFHRLCRQAREMYCITEHDDNVRRLRATADRVEVLWTNGHYHLLRLRNG